MLKLFRFDVSAGRRGCDLDGLFIAHQESVDYLVGREVYFGEVCGKHSEVFFTLEDSHIQAVEDADQAFIVKLMGVFKLHDGGAVGVTGVDFQGYNPLSYIVNHAIDNEEMCDETYVFFEDIPDYGDEWVEDTLYPHVWNQKDKILELQRAASANECEED